MNCKKCGYVLTDEDLFCKNCGEAVSKENVPSLQVVSPVMVAVEPTPVVETPVMVTVEPIPVVETPAMVTVEPTPAAAPVNETPSMMSVEVAPFVQPVKEPAIPPIHKEVEQPTMVSQPKTFEDNKKEPLSKWVIVVFAILIIIIIVLVIIILTTDNKEVGSTKDADIAVVSEKKYKIEYAGFSFEIPGELTYNATKDILAFGDEKGSWIAQMMIDKGSFAQLKKNKSSIQFLYQKEGYNATAAEEKTVGGVDFITLEISSPSGDKGIASYAKLNTGYYASVFVSNRDNDFDYPLLEKVAVVIQSAKETSSTRNMMPLSNIRITIPEELVKEK